MSSFTEPLIVKKLEDQTWEVAKAFKYHIGSEDSDEIIKVPKGFITDFASVPRFAWIIIPPDGNYTQSAVLHDFLYHTKRFTRRKSDGIFLEAMKVLKVPLWKRLIMYWAVRLFGWISWNRRKPFLPNSMKALLATLILLCGCSTLDLTYISLP